MKNITTLLIALFMASICVAQYQPVEHRAISGNEIAVKTAGSYAKAGATYVLANDISSEASTVFLGKDVTLDLNGYTIKYANANYGHIQNGGFEEGLQGWDISKAPGAEVVSTADVHVFLGEKLMSLKAGDEIVSLYVHLPVANRSYFAMCGITGHYYHDMKKYPRDEMRVSVYVENEKGNEVTCLGEYGDGAKQGCPVENKRPRLGGGFVYAHLTGLPAGKYRVRVKADTDCLVDEIDIRPAMDAAISIIEKTTPMAHYDHVIAETRPPTIPAFYDYTEDMTTGSPLSSLPQIVGGGTITIKNGAIENGVAGIQSWAIQSSAEDVKIILENVNIKASGISCGAIYVPYADISNCRFDVDMPFLIQRHVGLCSVVIRGENPTEIANCEFNGGQGCLSIKAKNSLIHDNLFVNNQTMTNHYSIMGTGEGSKIYNNRFEPRQGSGIYVSRYTEVFDNIFKIETSPPTCEYGREEYSTAAIRLGDYHAVPGSPRASVGSRIHGNKIYITAKNYPEPEKYTPMCWGIYYSARGGENFVYNNDIVVNKIEPSSKVKTAALYICGGPEYFGGQFYNNRITTNVPAAWIATMYGGASNSRLYNNTIIPLDGASFKTFQIGSLASAEYVAQNVEFRSNKVEGGKMEIDATEQDHIYSVYWTLNIKVADQHGNPVNGAGVQILDKDGKEVLNSKTPETGIISEELVEYDYRDREKSFKSPYKIITGESTKKIDLDENKEITIVI
tara:strand:- start:19096 stop:21300 length:2205 start_codon:yes stop_codon:yes gene_type:complete